ncbi:MAG TPA: hypothetical protein PLL20_07650 [Phycisphaerae bacterium]|nr:hypothetical protein [Phycisphaerae bacterium]HRR85752.1 hypothetical protein [Phycisphaerae bacterium]
MGKETEPAVHLAHPGRRTRFCCKPGKNRFEANPAKYLAKLGRQLSTVTKPTS